MSTENETLRALIRDVTNIPEASYYMPRSWHDQVIALSLDGKLDAPTPVSAQPVVTDQEGKPSYASQMAKRWESIMPAPAADADPCPKCIPGTVCRTPKCGRLRAQHQPIGIDSEGGSHD